MLFTEWNLEDAIAVAKEETWEDAQKEFRREAQKEREELFAYLKQGHSIEEAEKLFASPLSI